MVSRDNPGDSAERDIFLREICESPDTLLHSAEALAAQADALAGIRSTLEGRRVTLTGMGSSADAVTGLASILGRRGMDCPNIHTAELLHYRMDALGPGAAVVAAGGDAGNKVLFKDRRDPRITRVGRVLRRTSLDELPQLFNVVRGDMSLVGPRPALPQEVAEYDSEARRRLLVKPGLTGLWQVSGRSDLSWDSTVALDRHYVENRGAQLDVEILANTLKAVVGGRGAY